MLHAGVFHCLLEARHEARPVVLGRQQLHRVELPPRQLHDHELKSKAACLETCKPPSANDTEEAQLPAVCRAARSAPCSTAKMRFPFFAARKPGGGFKCVEASAERLQRRLCLAPGNIFASIKACNATCKRGGSEKN